MALIERFSWNSPGLKRVRLNGAEASLAVVRAVKLSPALDTWPIGEFCAALKAGRLVSALVSTLCRPPRRCGDAKSC